MEQPEIEMRGINKSFGAIKALQNVDFYAAQDEVVGLVGDNGAGKSTLIKILTGMYPPDTGKILFAGKEVRFSSPLQARELGVETIYQDLALVEDLPIYRNILLGKELQKQRVGIKILDETRMREESEKVLRSLKIDIRSVEMPVRYLSGGQRQCVAIARAIYWNAKILLMDEPVAALGAAETEMVLELIRRLKKEGKTVVVIAHNLLQVFSVCDRVSVLRKGKMVGNRQVKDTSIDDVTDMIVGRGKYREPEALVETEQPY
jgi:ABC-type sugar transport system ATPase subunit